MPESGPTSAPSAASAPGISICFYKGMRVRCLACQEERDHPGSPYAVPKFILTSLNIERSRGTYGSLSTIITFIGNGSGVDGLILHVNTHICGRTSSSGSVSTTSTSGSPNRLTTSNTNGELGAHLCDSQSHVKTNVPLTLGEGKGTYNVLHGWLEKELDLLAVPPNKDLIHHSEELREPPCQKE